MLKVYHKFLVVSPNYYGVGDTLKQAKANLKKVGGYLDKQLLTVIAVSDRPFGGGDDEAGIYVDGMGWIMTRHCTAIEIARRG